MVVLFCLRVIKNSPFAKGGKGIGFLFLLLFSMSITTYSQQLTNPSFEGVFGVARIPTAWQPCEPSSSPDTQPGAWSVKTEASHGNSYISMVCRGFSITNSYLWESCVQTLNNSLIVGETYHYSIDLAHSKTFLADTFHFNTPAQLRIWGRSNNNEKELLWESGAIANTEWETHYFEVTPNNPTDYLILEAYYVELPKYNGNILIDNMQYYPNPPLIKEHLITGLEEFILSEAEVESPKGIAKADTIPNQINDRPINETTAFTFRGDKLTITVWDNRTTDGDVISLFLNDKNILKEFTISKNRLDVEVTVEEGKEYYLTLFAHNLGEIPPNTVAMYISDGLRKKFITLTSDLKACGAIKLKIEHELVENL